MTKFEDLLVRIGDVTNAALHSGDHTTLHGVAALYEGLEAIDRDLTQLEQGLPPIVKTTPVVAVTVETLPEPVSPSMIEVVQS